MGNKIARTTQASASEYYLHDLPSSFNLVLKEVLGSGRFFKSIQCKHDEGLVLVKVYFKRGDSVDLRDYERRLTQIRDIFRTLDHQHDRRHVWPFQFWLETDKAAYLLRQYFFNNLHDRLGTRPFLSIVEKRWLAFQLLYAVKQCHENGVCHGDIKCENVLVTSWNWLYLADFASFKPTYIPHDDPSDFSFFFDTGGRRRCYLAPERFYEHGGEMQVAHDAPLKPSMDIFAVGCVVAELFLEGQPLFELSQLLAYRRAQYDPCQHLEKIRDSEIRKMILHMIQLDPKLRLSAESYLQTYASVVFPSYFSPFLHNFYSCLNPLDSDTRVVFCQSALPEIHKQMIMCKSSDDIKSGKAISSIAITDKLSAIPVDLKPALKLTQEEDSVRNSQLTGGILHDQFRLLGDINSLLTEVSRSHSEPSDTMLSGMKKKYGLHSPQEILKIVSNAFLERVTGNNLNLLMSCYDSQSGNFGKPLLPLSPENKSCDGMVLIASLLCSCLRNVKLPHLRRGAILLLKSSASFIDDEDRLQRVLPYIIAMLSDSTAIVRCAALEALCDILPLVRDFPPSDAKIFPEYILPMLSMLPDDPEESVRICYATSISKLALTAYGFLTHSLSSSEAGVLDELKSPELAQLRKSVADVVQELVMGSKQTPNIRRALLQDICYLCCFFGQRLSNDFLLPLLPAFLNDRDESLRAVFYGQIVFVCFFVGERSVEEYLLPYIQQALSDATEGVIVNGLNCLAILCRSGLLRKRILLETIERAFPLLCYPSQWVRRSAVSFIAASSDNLGHVDSYVYLAPIIGPFLCRQPSSLASEKALFACLKPPVSRHLFYEVSDNARGSDMLERQRKIWYNPSSSHSKQWGSVDFLLQDETHDSNPSKWPEKAIGSKSVPLDLNERDLTNPSTSVNDPLWSDKLQFSGVMSSQAGGLNSYIGDKSSEGIGIPLYSFSIDKRTIPSNTESSLHLNSIPISSSSVPWMDPKHKPFSLASSVPTPKFVPLPGSLSFTNTSKQFYRVVHEPESRESGQTDYIGSQIQDRGSKSLGSSISGAAEDESAKVSLSSQATQMLDSGWRPRGVLIAHLPEHRSAVNDITVSSDHNFFVTASDDSTVKVWDSRKLEKDISFRSKLTYSLDGSRALCTAMFRGSTQVVVGSSDGDLHVFSVDYVSKGLGNAVEKYSGIVDQKKMDRSEGAIPTLLNYPSDGCATNMVMYSTKNCGIHLWDTRTNSNAWSLKANPKEGYVLSMVGGSCGNWFASGSSRGVLALWDLRFLVPVNAWKSSGSCPIEKLCLFVPSSTSPLSTVVRPLVYVAAGCNEVSLWNAENWSCHQVFRLPNNDNDAETCEPPWALTKPSKPNLKTVGIRNGSSKYRVDDLNHPPPRLPGIRTLLPLPGGDLLSGGTDLKIRRWDHSSPDRSYCVCGPSLKGAGNDDFYETRSSFGVQIVQETKRRPLRSKLTGKAILAAAATDSAGCHRDSILSLASVKLNQRLLVSGSRDGAIKVWK